MWPLTELKKQQPKANQMIWQMFHLNFNPPFFQGSKCPSGCRMQGLIDEADHDFHDRINKLKKMLSENQNSYKKAVIVKQETIDILSQNLVNEQGKYHPHNRVDTCLLIVTHQKKLLALFFEINLP